MIRILVAMAVIAGSAPHPASRIPHPAKTDTVPGAELSIFLITIGHGDEIWELFGHNAIRIQDEKRGTDISYNWGVFDFAQPGFLKRFLTGDTRYWVEGWDTFAMIDAYRARNRSVWMQRLNLTPEQRLALRDSIEWNARDENKYYRYDYFRDNCSTRVRDALDRVLGGRIKAATANVPTRTTYRWHTRRLTDPQLWTYTGINIALGQPADAEISAWDEMFLPVRMRERLRAVRVPDVTGREVPLVAREMQLFLATRPPELLAPRSHMVRYLVLGFAGVAIAVGLAWLMRVGHVAARRGLATIAVVWFAIAGVSGIVLVLAWTATRHVYWARNENLLLFSPIAVLLALLIPSTLRGTGGRRSVELLAGIVAVLAVLALLIKPLPWFDQVNGEIIAFALPIDLALAGLIWTHARRTELKHV